MTKYAKAKMPKCQNAKKIKKNKTENEKYTFFVNDQISQKMIHNFVVENTVDLFCWIFQQLNLLQCLGAYFPKTPTTTEATGHERRNGGD